VLVLDLRMPGVTGLEAVPEIRSASPDTRIVVYSQYIDERTEAELTEAGVEAWVRKDEDLSELRATVLSVGGLNHA
jgi:DNA-binding NarL/FixJ family response regulator